MNRRLDNFSGGELDAIESEGKSLWEKRNTLTESDKKDRDKAIESLKKFQRETPHDETKYIRRLEKAKSSGEVKEIIEKARRAGIKWYEKQMRASGTFEPMNDAEVDYMRRELEGTMKHFSSLNLDGEYQMIDTIIRLEEDLKPRKEFRANLKKQSKFVQGEYFRRIGSLKFLESKQGLLDSILSELEGVEDAPSAVQYEFRKKQKSAGSSKDTKKLRSEVMDGFEKRKGKYLNEVFTNSEYFGGEEIQTPYGKMPQTAFEFIEWFEDRESFAAMDDATKKLPALINERKKLYKERDEILEHAKPADRDRLVKKTKLMRRHELKAFLPELREQVQKNSIHVAEYEATLISARHKGVPLILPFERATLSRRFRLVDLESQASRLKILEEDVKDRARIVDDYLSLPSYLRNDSAFVAANENDRERMLNDALKEKAAESDSPFDISDDKDLGAEDAMRLSEALDSSQGRDVMNDIMEELEREGELKAAEVQAATYKKIFGSARRAENRAITQKESYLDDLKYWVRLDQNVKKEADATTDRQRSKLHFINAADEAYDKGKVVTSGGVVSELQTISAAHLESGGGDVLEHLNRARYGEHVRVDKKDGGDTRDPLELIERMSEKEVARIALLAINKLAEGQMGMRGTNLSVLRNSHNMQREMSARLIDSEFDHLNMAA